MAPGIASIFGGPLAARLHGTSGAWTVVFYLAIAPEALTAVRRSPRSSRCASGT